MEIPLKRVFFALNSPQRRPRALPGHYSATMRHLRGKGISFLYVVSYIKVYPQPFDLRGLSTGVMADVWHEGG